MYSVSAISVLLTITSTFLYVYRDVIMAKSFAITFGTISYHFLMRLAVGFAFDIFMKNQADYSLKWYQCRPWEVKLYRWLKVKQWKSKLPTYDPGHFDPKQHTWSEIIQAMCQAELVHEVIVVLSFVPIVLSHWFDDLLVFVITSLCAALFDTIFVILQRYNRPRIIRFSNR